MPDPSWCSDLEVIEEDGVYALDRVEQLLKKEAKETMEVLMSV
jgi:hypothetical protein